MLRDQLRAIVADWIGAGLKAKGWKNTQLAKASGVSREQIWKLKERKADATDDTLAALAEALGTPLPTLAVRDSKGRAEYEMGVRDALQAVQATLDQIKAVPTPPVEDGPDDDLRQNAAQASRQSKAGQPPAPPTRPHRKSG